MSGAALLALAVGSASAATTVSVAMDSAFGGGAEGWTKAPNEQSSPLCLEGLTCPKVTDEYQAAGGVEGSGYIETKEAGLLALGAMVESTGTWESPEFTYLGVAGQRPTKVELSLARRAQLADLLGLAGAGATYTVELVDKTTPSAPVVVTNRAPLGAAEEWKRTSTAISPTLLTKGDSYKVRIRTAFVSPATAVPAGGVGYDDVKLTASREEADEGSNGPGSSEGSGGGDGTGARKGANGGNGTSAGGGSEGSGGPAGSSGKTGGAAGVPGSRVLSTAELRTAIASQGLGATASLRRGRLMVTGTCPKAIRGACTVRIRGMLSRHRPVTSSRRAKIAAGRRHSFVVTVHPRARAKVRQHRKLLVEERVRVGKARVTLYKRLRLVPG